jgi:DNA helicase TIP49 (TBP-interacting protein)
MGATHTNVHRSSVKIFVTLAIGVGSDEIDLGTLFASNAHVLDQKTASYVEDATPLPLPICPMEVSGMS